MFESWYASRETPESTSLLDRVRDAGRAEARSAAQRLVAIGELFVLRCRDSGEREEWGTDTWDAVAAQVAAALRVSLAMGSSYLGYAKAMRDRLPQVGKVFLAGDIDYRAFQTIVFRTDLITDADIMAKVDARLAALLARCPSITRGRLAAAVDQVVAKVDRDAVRRAAKAGGDRRVDVTADASGMAWLEGSLFATDGQVLDRRLDELAATVCEADPRTRDQRRADALGALAAGADALLCQCGSSHCAAAGRPRRSNVMIHIVAEQATVAGTGSAPGVLPGYEGLIPAGLVAELAKSAQLVPIRPPGDAPESGYAPSARLAEFVRCRDLTCRAPGCDRPAVQCEIDHTVPYAGGGATHASNLKCLCKKHHLLKTFWGWRDKQLLDGTVIWLLPGGDTYVTTPGSALLFPGLCVPTGELPRVTSRPGCAGREAMMPTRTRTRRQHRAERIGRERGRNRRSRESADVGRAVAGGSPGPPSDGGEPPPF